LTARRLAIVALTLLLLPIAATSCDRPAPANQVRRPSSEAPAASDGAERAASSVHHDLSADEAMGGHTLARHVGKTDDDLRRRLRREPDISSASTYTDRETAEDVVGAALSSAGRPFDAWRSRTGGRPNFVLHFEARRVIGRSIRRGRLEAMPCEDALVVLRWDDRHRQFYVLTSYPEVRR
jgi:hypothetical protein